MYHQYRIQIEPFEWSDWRIVFEDYITRNRSSGTFASSGDLRATSPSSDTSDAPITVKGEVVMYDSGRLPFTALVASSVKDTGGLEMVFHVSTWILNSTNIVLAYSQPVVRSRHDMTYAAGQ